MTKGTGDKYDECVSYAWWQRELRSRRRVRESTTAYGLDEHHREIFSLTSLNEAVPVYSDAAKAVASA